MSATRRTFLKRAAYTTAASGLLVTTNAATAKDEDSGKDEPDSRRFEVYPVGRVEEAKEGEAHIRIYDRYADALLGLDGWSHVNVFWWFDRNDDPRRRGILRVHPRGDRSNPLTGVFACRAPVRPNLIALTVCKILAVDKNVVRVDKIDALDGTPVLDLKPFIPPDAPTRDIRVPEWTRSGRPPPGR